MRYQFGPYQFDTRNAQLEGPQGLIALRPMTLKLLHALLEAAPDLISHEQLLDQVWGRQAVTPGVLSQSIRELRRALGDSAQDSAYIETRHKMGYRFMGPLARITDDQANAGADNENVLVPSAPLTNTAVSSPADRLRWPIALVAIAIVTLIGLALLLRQNSDTLPAPEQAVEILHDGRPREPDALRWYRDGLDALAAHDPTRAQEHFERALQREPASIAALAGLAQALAERGEVHRAIALAEPLREGGAALPREAQLRIAAFLAQLEHHNDEALRHLNALAALNPGDADTGLRLAALQIQTGNTLDAEATLTRLERLPRIHRARLALLRAHLAGVRGEHATRLSAAQEAAVASAIDTPLHAEALLEQATALQLTGDIAAANAIHTTLTALPDLPGWPAIRLRANLLGAALARDIGELQEAIETFRQCAADAHNLSLPALNTAARREAAHVDFLAGRYDDAIAQLDGVIREQTTLGDPRALASTLGVASLVQQRRGDQVAAQDLVQRALAAYITSGDLTGQATTRNTLGMLLFRTGRHDEGQEQWETALALFERIGVRRGAATTRSNLAIAHGHAGRTVAARQANEAALAIFRDIDATPDIARLQFNLGIQDRRNGDLAQADIRLTEALDGFTQLGAESFRLQAIATLSELRLLRGDTAGAHLLLADLQAAELSPPERAAAIASAQARLSMLRGNMESAATGFALARQLREHAGLADWVLMSDLDLAELAALSGDLMHAEQSARALRRQMTRQGDARAALQVGLLLAAVRHAQGDHEGTARLLDTLEEELSAQPDALLALRLDLIRAAQTLSDRRQALAHFATRARAAGYELLALRADALSGDESRAHRRLNELDIQMRSISSTLPY